MQQFGELMTNFEADCIIEKLSLIQIKEYGSNK